MKIVDAARVAELTGTAVHAPRRRTHFNLHDDLADPIQRVVIALEPGTYICPHRHADTVWEMFAVLKGACALFTFDDAGTVTERVDLRAGAALAGQVPPGAWHSIVALAPGTVVLEVKPGPYRAPTDKNFAAWAPREGEPGTEALLRWLEGAQVGATPPIR